MDNESFNKSILTAAVSAAIANPIAASAAVDVFTNPGFLTATVPTIAELQAATNDIATNSTNIATNSTNIGTNGTNISNIFTQVVTNTQDIATNSTNIATNSGNIATNSTNIATNSGGIATNSANIASIGGGAANVFNGTGDINVNSATVGAGGLTVNGSTKLNGDTSIASGNTRVSITNGAASMTVQSAVDSTKRNGVAVSGSAASLTVVNSSGGQNGIIVTDTSTTLRGGTGTTEIVLDDSGATVQSADGSPADLTVTGNANIGGSLKLNPNVPTNFGGNRLQNIGDGVNPTDAVTVRQLDSGLDDVQDDARRGIAIANALDVFMPDPGKSFRVNLGGGHYSGMSAIGLTGSGRINEDVAVYFGLGTDTDGKETGGKIGVSYQW